MPGSLGRGPCNLLATVAVDAVSGPGHGPAVRGGSAVSARAARPFGVRRPRRRPRPLRGLRRRAASPIVFTPADTIVDARMWKAQVAHLARRHRVVVIDPRGNGGSDRPLGHEHYTDLLAWATCSPSWTPSASTGRWWWGSATARGTGSWPRRRGTPTASRGSWRSRPGAERRDAEARPRPRHRRQLERGPGGPPGLAAVQRGRLAARLAVVPSVLLLPDLQRPAQQQDLRGRRRLGRPAPRRGDDLAGERRVRRRRPTAVAETLAAISCPVLVIHGTHDLCQPFARGVHMAPARRRRAARARASRTPAPGALSRCA